MAALSETGLQTSRPLLRTNSTLVQVVRTQDGTEQLVTTFTWMNEVPLRSLTGTTCGRNLVNSWQWCTNMRGDWPPSRFLARRVGSGGSSREHVRGDDPASSADGTARPRGYCSPAVKRCTTDSRQRHQCRPLPLIHADLNFENALVQDGRDEGSNSGGDSEPGGTCMTLRSF